MSDECRIWIGSLAAYNAGTLHGSWVSVTDALAESGDDLDDATETLRRCVGIILAACPEHGEEFGIFDYEGFGSARIAEYADLRGVAALALGIERHGPVFGGWSEEFNDIEEALSAFEDRYVGQYRDMRDFGEQHAEAVCLLDGVPESLRYHVDLTAWAQDLELGGDIETHWVEGRLRVFYSA